MLSAQSRWIRAFAADLGGGTGLDGICLVQARILVALTLIGVLIAPVGQAISLIAFPVSPIGPSVAPIVPPATPIGPSITPVRRQIPPSANITLVRGVVALVTHAVARLAGSMSLRRDVVAQVRSQIAALHLLLTLLRRLRGGDPTLRLLVGERWPRPLRGDPIPLFGNFVARVSHPLTFVGDAGALVSHAVTLVGGALALVFLGLGNHHASLPQ